jgi:hypothetical protein
MLGAQVFSPSCKIVEAHNDAKTKHISILIAPMSLFLDLK